MKIQIKEHPVYGECLFADNGVIEYAVPLSFGLRVGHFSFVGKENVFFVQPPQMEAFTTPEGWRLYGGHRLWLAPEAPRTYAPDNLPISYQREGDTLVFTQREDPVAKVIKSFHIRLEENRLFITHHLQNTAETALTCSLWGISVMAPFGVETIWLEKRENGMDPLHRFTYWDHTNPGDPRVCYEKDRIRIHHQALECRFKIGVGHPVSPVSYDNGSTVFQKHFSIDKNKEYPDGNVSYETFLSQYMVEVESLSPLTNILPGETAEHKEIWELLHK